MIKKLLAIAAAALFCSSASAGYAQLAPPAGWTPGAYAPAANDASYGRIIHSPNGPTATVGGQAVRMPAAYRLAANAPRIAAAAIYLNPYVRTGVAIATWLGVAGLVYDSASGLWKKTASPGEYPVSTGLEYMNRSGQWVTDWDAACKSFRSDYFAWAGHPGQCSWPGGGISQALQTRQSQCPANWYYTPAGCVINPPPRDVTKPEFEDLLAPKPMPERVPQELPYPTPLPIEQPSPWINPDPGANPQHRPRFVPTGDPLPNPNYDPNAPVSPENQPWYQPGVRIVPSPTVTEPWRVDYQPVARPQPTKDPVTQPENEPGTKPEDKAEQPDLCEKNPGIVACENGDINDVGLPPIPTLYERKYPEGLTGIWNQKSQQIKQSSTFTLAEQLMPTTLTAGACPSWVIPLNFASWASYGEYNVAPPCWIWDVAKTIIIISALMLARSLIFGG